MEKIHRLIYFQSFIHFLARLRINPLPPQKKFLRFNMYTLLHWFGLPQEGINHLTCNISVENINYNYLTCHILSVENIRVPVFGEGPSTEIIVTFGALCLKVACQFPLNPIIYLLPGHFFLVCWCALVSESLGNYSRVIWGLFHHLLMMCTPVFSVFLEYCVTPTINSLVKLLYMVLCFLLLIML